MGAYGKKVGRQEDFDIAKQKACRMEEGHTLKLIFRSFLDFFRDNGPLLAGSVACFFLMSFLPFCLLLVSIFGYSLGGHGEFYDFFSSRLMSFFPAATSEISRELTAVVTYREIGIFTFVIYTYFSYQLYLALETAVHVIFRQKVKRSKIFSVLRSFFVITLVVAFLFVSFAATSAIRMLKPLAVLFPGLKIGIITRFLVGAVIPVCLVLLITTTLYKLLPQKKVRLGSAFLGGIFTSVLLEAARHLFTFYVITQAARFGALYGSLSAFVIFLLWIFYSACIFLVGAEIVRNLEATGVKRA